MELTAVLRDAGAGVAAALDSLDDLPGWPPTWPRSTGWRTRATGSAARRWSSLFAGGIDPMVVIRWKDVFERLEQAIDACERVAHVLEGIAVKQAG